MGIFLLNFQQFLGQLFNEKHKTAASGSMQKHSHK